VGNAVGICSDGGAEGIMGGDGVLVVGLDVETREGTTIGSGSVAGEGVFEIKDKGLIKLFNLYRLVSSLEQISTYYLRRAKRISYTLKSQKMC
jgi:hypothetical protein